MNLLLLNKSDYIDDCTVEIFDRRHQHLKKIKKVQPGDKIPVGIINGDMGYGQILDIDKKSVRIHITEQFAAPNAVPFTVIVALPRPLMLKRILQSITAIGIKEIHFIDSEKVEKSYWDSSDLKEHVIYQQCLLGLEQAMDTFLPKVVFHRQFHLFVQDILPSLCQEKTALLGDILGEPCPANITKPTILAIGPESGFTEKEKQLFQQQGFTAVTLGPRTLRVETAVSALLGRLLPC